MNDDQPLPRTRNRGPNSIQPTKATEVFFEKFLRPFVEKFFYAEGETFTGEGYNAFFGTERVAIWFCKAKRDFRMPGLMWLDPPKKGHYIPGTGQRDVKEGATLILRYDKENPRVCELEYADQVFQLRELEYNVISEYLEREG